MIKTERLAPAQPVDDVWRYTGDPAIAYRAVAILAAHYEQQVRVVIILAAVLLGVVLTFAGALSGVLPLFALAAAAYLTATLGWAIWFTRWQ